MAEGRRFVVATVVATHGSTPQTVGAKLIVLTTDESERPFGTLGGGCVEADAVIAAREVLVRGGRELREYQLTEELAWNTGLVCGGTMWILAERNEEAWHIDGRDVWPDIAAAVRGGNPIALVTRLKKRGRSFAFERKAIVRADGSFIGSLGDTAIDARAATAALEQIARGPAALFTVGDEDRVLIDPVVSRPRLIIAGGGHVAKAIARQARLVDFDVTVLEDRPEFADSDRFDGAHVVVGDVPASVAAFPYEPASYLIIATRGHKLDADCVLAAARSDVRYIGVLGSRRKTALIAELLRTEGIPEERLETIHAPVGLDLGGRTPAEIAVSIIAEILQLRYQGSGRPLRSE